MALRALTLPDQDPISLPQGLVVLYAPSSSVAQTVRAALGQALAADLELTPAQGRLCLVEGIDPALGTHPELAIQAAHYGELWAAFAPEIPPDPTATDEATQLLRRRLTTLRAQLALAQREADARANSFEVTADVEALNRQLLEIRHALKLVENEIQREMSGFIEIPNAAHQVTRLGEVQARIKGEYFELNQQRTELESRRDAAHAQGRKLQQEGGRKIILAAIFVFLGITALLSAGVPPHLKPLGWVVILLGALLGYQSSQAAKFKETPKERVINKQLQDLAVRLQDVDERQKEADRQVKQFCARVGCTSPGQVVELQRRFEQKQEERALLAEEIVLVERALTRQAEGAMGGAPTAANGTGYNPAGSPVAVAESPAELLATIGLVEAELAGRERRWPSPELGAVLQKANAVAAGWGGVSGPEIAGLSRTELTFNPLKSLTITQKALLYLALRVALLDGFRDGKTKLPLVLDDPLRFWDDAALADGLGPLKTLAQDGWQVVFATSRPAVLDAWRTAARTQGQVLTVIELGHAPSQV